MLCQLIVDVHFVNSGMDNVQPIVLLWGSVTWKVQILARQATCSVLMCFQRRWVGNVDTVHIVQCANVLSEVVG